VTSFHHLFITPSGGEGVISPKTSHMEQEKKKNKQLVPILAMALVTAGALTTTAYFQSKQGGFEQSLATALADRDKAQAESVKSAMLLGEADKRLAQAHEQSAATASSMSILEGKLRETEAQADALQRSAGQNEKQSKELAQLKAAADQLRDQLETSRKAEKELLAQADKARADRDALAQQLENKAAIALMLNNSGIDAHRKKQGKLTVKARRTNEVVMAFELPEGMAKGVNYRITSPSGKVFTGAEPIVSNRNLAADATASAGSASGKIAPKVAKVLLSFKPAKKLEPGVYRIDVSSDQEYLQSFQLNLR
jgi:hypothetical protein